MFSQLSDAVVRHKANDGVVYATRAWFKYDLALSAVVKKVSMQFFNIIKTVYKRLLNPAASWVKRVE